MYHPYLYGARPPVSFYPLLEDQYLLDPCGQDPYSCIRHAVVDYLDNTDDTNEPRSFEEKTQLSRKDQCAIQSLFTMLKTYEATTSFVDQDLVYSYYYTLFNLFYYEVSSL